MWNCMHTDKISYCVPDLCECSTSITSIGIEYNYSICLESAVPGCKCMEYNYKTVNTDNYYTMPRFLCEGWTLSTRLQGLEYQYKFSTFSCLRHLTVKLVKYEDKAMSVSTEKCTQVHVQVDTYWIGPSLLSVFLVYCASESSHLY